MLDRLGTASGALKGKEGLSRALRGLLAVLLVVWLAWLVADTLWLMIAGPTQQVSLDESMVRIGSEEQAESSLGLARIRNWELFGSPQAAAVAATPVEAPETRLRLELQGVFQNPDAAQASAIIAEQGKDGELYQAGDRVPGNATLEEVLTDRVILMRLGQRETLKLKEPDLGGSVERAQPDSSSARAAPPSALPGDEPSTAETERLPQQRERIIGLLGLTPAEQGGYRIGDGAPAEQLSIIGLRPGDVLVSVNGYELGAESNDVAALLEFHNTGVASIVVQRGEQRFTVNYPP